MTTTKTHPTKKNSIYKLDPNSDRYRICPYDGIEFMASHRSMIYCDDRCADEFHNRKKREEKLELTAELMLIEAQPQEKAIQSLPVVGVSSDTLKRNLDLLASWPINDTQGTIYHMEWMHEQGYDFSSFSGIGALHNIDPVMNCQFAQIGYYRLYRIEYSHILIVKTKKQK